MDEPNQTRVVPLSKGIRTGRPAIAEDKKSLILDLYWNTGLGIRRIADRAGVSHMTVWRTVRGTWVVG